MILRNRRSALYGYIASAAFQVALMSFGWGFWTWSVPVLVFHAFVIRDVLRARRQTVEPMTLRAAA